MSDDTRFEDVPAAPEDAVVDEHWQELRRGGPLPTAYMPPAMAGPRRPSLRVVAGVLVGVFMLATFCGVCLTYGPGY